MDLISGILLERNNPNVTAGFKCPPLTGPASWTPIKTASPNPKLFREKWIHFWKGENQFYEALPYLNNVSFSHKIKGTTTTEKDNDKCAPKFYGQWSNNASNPGTIWKFREPQKWCKIKLHCGEISALL